MNTVKNCYSPVGMGYSTYGAELVHLIDCPGCKYGTMDLVTKENEKPITTCDEMIDRIKWENEKRMKCADCGRVYRFG